MTAADLKAAGTAGTGGGAIVAAAQTQIGTPYVWGGTTPYRALDCSGLTQWCYAQAGIRIPRNSEDQAGRRHARAALAGPARRHPLEAGPRRHLHRRRLVHTRAEARRPRARGHGHRLLHLRDQVLGGRGDMERRKRAVAIAAAGAVAVLVAATLARCSAARSASATDNGSGPPGRPRRRRRPTRAGSDAGGSAGETGEAGSCASELESREWMGADDASRAPHGVRRQDRRDRRHRHLHLELPRDLRRRGELRALDHARGRHRCAGDRHHHGRRGRREAALRAAAGRLRLGPGADRRGGPGHGRGRRVPVARGRGRDRARRSPSGSGSRCTCPARRRPHSTARSTSTRTRTA
jgi:hypothetical protein